MWVDTRAARKVGTGAEDRFLGSPRSTTTDLLLSSLHRKVQNQKLSSEFSSFEKKREKIIKIILLEIKKKSISNAQYGKNS